MSTLQTRRDSDFEARKRAERVADIAEDAPRFVKLFLRVYSGKASPREAIRAHCLECIGFEVAAVKDCGAPACPLYEYRPYQEERAN